MKKHGVLEVAIFKVKAAEVANMPTLRAGLREALKSFPGLVEYQAYGPIEADSFADIAWWENLECALAASNAFEQGDVRFLPYMHAIEKIDFMGHFRPEMP